MPTQQERDALLLELQARARDIHSRMCDGERLGARQHEEALTSHLLLELARAQPNVRVATFNHFEENRDTGADWEWWWEGERNWFGALVQAKCLKKVAGGVLGYDFAYTPAPSVRNPTPARQIDVLLSAGYRRGVPPMYALYNGDGLDVAKKEWRCGEKDWDPPSMGVAILPAPVASWLVGLQATDQHSVNGYALPLHCHICPKSCIGRPGALRWLFRSRDLPPPELLGFHSATTRDDPAFLAAVAYLEVLAVMRAGQFRGLGPSERIVDIVRTGVRNEPPSYVYEALEGATEVSSNVDADDGSLPGRVVVMKWTADSEE